MPESDRVINYEFELELTMRNIFWASLSTLYLFTDARVLPKILAYMLIHAKNCKRQINQNSEKYQKQGWMKGLTG